MNRAQVLELIDQQGQMREADIVAMERTHNRQAGTINVLASLYREGVLKRERTTEDGEPVTYVSRVMEEEEVSDGTATS